MLIREICQSDGEAPRTASEQPSLSHEDAAEQMSEEPDPPTFEAVSTNEATGLWVSGRSLTVFVPWAGEEQELSNPSGMPT